MEDKGGEGVLLLWNCIIIAHKNPCEFVGGDFKVNKCVSLQSFPSAILQTSDFD